MDTFASIDLIKTRLCQAIIQSFSWLNLSLPQFKIKFHFCTLAVENRINLQLNSFLNGEQPWCQSPFTCSSTTCYVMTLIVNKSRYFSQAFISDVISLREQIHPKFFVSLLPALSIW